MARKASGVRSEGVKTADSRPTTADRFEKALESIRENIGKAEEKTLKEQDATAEVAEVLDWLRVYRDRPYYRCRAYMISGAYNGMIGKLIAGTLLFILCVMFVILDLITGPETLGLGYVIFGYLAILSAQLGIMILYGKEKADKFVLCLLEKAGIHIAADGLIHALEHIPLAAMKILAKYVAAPAMAIEGLVSLKNCIEGLQQS